MQGIVHWLIETLFWLLWLPFRIMSALGVPIVVQFAVGVALIVLGMFAVNSYAVRNRETTTGRIIRFSIPSKFFDQLTVQDFPKVVAVLAGVAVMLVGIWMVTGERETKVLRPKGEIKVTRVVTPSVPVAPAPPVQTPQKRRTNAVQTPRKPVERVSSEGTVFYAGGGWRHGTPGEVGFRCKGSGCP